MSSEMNSNMSSKMSSNNNKNRLVRNKTDLIIRVFK